MSAGADLVRVVLPSGESEEFTDVDHVSFVNEESYGPASTFGVVDADGDHKTLILSTRNFAAVEVTS